jgi:hypothetical protein
MSVNIKVHNFQSITDADITVDGFTILVGESSQGKSACMRAVNAACNNRFKQGFLKYGTDEMRIDIKYSDDDRTLSVTKTKKDSPTYQLGDTVYQKLNRTVPPEIDDFNGFGVIDNYEQKYQLNFFTQFSKPLLLEFSQKRILEILSSSKAFDDMNDAVSKLNKKKEQNNGAFKQLSQMITDNKTQLSSLSERESAIHDNIATVAEHMERLKEREKQTQTVEELSGLENARRETETRIKDLKIVIAHCEQISDVKDEIKRLDELNGYVTEQTESEKRQENTQKRISLCERYISLSERKKSNRTDLITELENLITESRSAQPRIKRLSETVKTAERCVNLTRRVNETSDGINRLTRLSELMDACRTAQKTIREKQNMIDNHICPVCGNKMV